MQDDNDEGIIRLTFMANFDKWKALERSEYRKEKEKVALLSHEVIKELMPSFDANLIYGDIFTPTTIKRYTGHYGGTVYGSPQKCRNGKTSTEGLYIIGTDQGFLGITGALLSGISMANLYGLKGMVK